MGLQLLPRSTTGRIAFAFAVVQLATLAAALLALQAATAKALEEEAAAFVSEINQDLTESYSQAGSQGLIAAIARRTQTVGRRDAVIGLARDGRLIAGNIEAMPSPDRKHRGMHEVSLTRKGMAEAEPALVLQTQLARGLRLVAGDTLVREELLRKRGQQALVTTLLFGTLLTVFGSLFMSRLIGRRVDEVAGVAAQVESGDLGQRVAIAGSGDSFDRLATAINAMLDRVQSLIAELRHVTDSLAHDLRSPVARLKARLDQALPTLANDEPARAALGAAIDEADGLQRFLSTALQISRAEAGIGRDQFQAFDAGEMLTDLAEVYGPLAEERGIAIRTDIPRPTPIFAHRELLGQALANLIDNALTYAEGASEVVLAVTANSGTVTIEVRDNGSGIPEDRYAEALKRFGRLDAARRAGGAGLGLSLVTTLAHLHGGDFSLGDNRPGLIARLVFPVTPA